MNAISSSVNKGALKVAPKAGGLRRTRPSGITQSRTKQQNNSSIVPTSNVDPVTSIQDADGAISGTARSSLNSVPVVAASASPSHGGNIHVAKGSHDLTSNPDGLDTTYNELSSDTIKTAAQHKVANTTLHSSDSLPADGENFRHSSDRKAVNQVGTASTSKNDTPVVQKSRASNPDQDSASDLDLANASLKSSRSDNVITAPRGRRDNIGPAEDTANGLTESVENNEQQRNDRSITVARDTMRKTSLQHVEEVDLDIDPTLVPERNEVKLRRTRNTRKKRELTPDGAEGEVIDTVSTKMVDLCRDTRKGRKSNKYAEFVKITAERKRRSRLADPSLSDSQQFNHKGPTETLEADLDTKLFERQMQTDVEHEEEGATDEEEDEEALLATTGAPQVRIVNGQIILDVSSLQVDRAVRDAAGDAGPVEYVEENPLEKIVNSRSYSKHKVTPRWDPLSTELFYSGLSQWGTDFDMISRMFPSRSRKQIKNKYTLEERKNPGLITQALIQKKPVDMAEYSKITEISFRPIAELEGELAALKARFESEREDAIREVEQRKLEALDDSANQPLADEVKRRSKRRRADDGLELVGSIEEVEEAARKAARLQAEISDDE